MALQFRSRAIDLYRKACREIPRTCLLFNLDVSEQEFRRRVRAKFERNRHLTNPSAIEKILMDGEQDFFEIQNHHAQRNHILELLKEEEDDLILIPKYSHESEFLKKFYDNQIH